MAWYDGVADLVRDSVQTWENNKIKEAVSRAYRDLEYADAVESGDSTERIPMTSAGRTRRLASYNPERRDDYLAAQAEEAKASDSQKQLMAKLITDYGWGLKGKDITSPDGRVTADAWKDMDNTLWLYGNNQAFPTSLDEPAGWLQNFLQSARFNIDGRFYDGKISDLTTWPETIFANQDDYETQLASLEARKDKIRATLVNQFYNEDADRQQDLSHRLDVLDNYRKQALSPLGKYNLGVRSGAIQPNTMQNLINYLNAGKDVYKYVNRPIIKKLPTGK